MDNLLCSFMQTRFVMLIFEVFFGDYRYQLSRSNMNCLEINGGGGSSSSYLVCSFQSSSLPESSDAILHAC